MAQNAVIIPEKIFFKIGEVCDILDVQAHVLRYWETEFPMLSPQKNRSGQRTYRRRDVEMALRIKALLYEDLYTIAGAKKRLQKEIREGSRLKIVKTESEVVKEVEAASKEDSIESELLEIEDFELEPELPDSKPEQEKVELSGDRREALKSLASQLLELREMLKSDQTLKAEEHIKKL
ncbi:MAG: MerR family transcriptional regulator [Acidobacteriota bacterium]|nr:MerR family transcriptional regulator [Acidobacteriota bacterium]MDH3529387.1 MerR family transcriptional regulator [Acidobacteriota bacterium]